MDNILNPTCPHCLHQIFWQNDYSYEDYGMQGDGIVTCWSCGNCGAYIEAYVPFQSEIEENDADLSINDSDE